MVKYGKVLYNHMAEGTDKQATLQAMFRYAFKVYNKGKPPKGIIIHEFDQVIHGFEHLDAPEIPTNKGGLHWSAEETLGISRLIQSKDKRPKD